MPRKKRERKVQMPPVIRGMSVSGVRGRKSNEIFLLLEEYEAIRLMDYRLMNQVEAARCMQISRPTLTRIYDQARQKVATAFVEGRSITIKGGIVSFEENWYTCHQCKTRFPGKEVRTDNCPVCRSENISFLNNLYN